MLEPFSVSLIDVVGKVRRIRSLPLSDRRWFLDCVMLLQERASTQDVRSLYDSDVTFKGLVDECLHLHGLQPSWLDAYMMTRLLFGMGDEPALLLQLNFPPQATQEATGRRIPENLDPTAYQVASLWSATESLESALRIATGHPWREVEATLEARLHQIKSQDASNSPGDDEQVERSREKMDGLIQSGKIQELLHAISRNGQPSTPQIEQLPDDYFPE